MFFKAVIKGSICFPNIEFVAQGAHDDVDNVSGVAGKVRFNGESFVGRTFDRGDGGGQEGASFTFRRVTTVIARRKVRVRSVGCMDKVVSDVAVPFKGYQGGATEDLA